MVTLFLQRMLNFQISKVEETFILGNHSNFTRLPICSNFMVVLLSSHFEYRPCMQNIQIGTVAGQEKPLFPQKLIFAGR